MFITFGCKFFHLCPWSHPFGPALGPTHSTGIPDFRSGMKTVLETGPGLWELQDADLTSQEKAKLMKEKQKKRVNLVKVLAGRVQHARHQLGSNGDTHWQ